MSRSGESLNHYEDLSRSYGLRENPKKTQKSPLDDGLGTAKRNKKSLIRCQECGKGFLYEKCLSNHLHVTHYEESLRRRLFCSFGVVQRRKRSKRVSRYKKKSHRFSVSSSSYTMFPVSVDDGDLLEVAESLILLSKSGGKFLNARECDDGVLRNHKHILDGTSKELVREKPKKDDDSDQKKQVGEGWFRAQVGLEGLSLEDRPGLTLQHAEMDMDQKLGSQESAFEMNAEHRCGLCDKVFSTYQALGGHQTFHRMRNKSKTQTKRCREESVEAEAEIDGSMTLMTHKCRVCSRLFMSVQALRGHKKCHRKRTFDGETFRVDVNASMVTGGIFELDY